MSYMYRSTPEILRFHPCIFSFTVPLKRVSKRCSLEIMYAISLNTFSHEITWTISINTFFTWNYVEYISKYVFHFDIFSLKAGDAGEERLGFYTGDIGRDLVKDIQVGGYIYIYIFQLLNFTFYLKRIILNIMFHVLRRSSVVEIL